MSFGKRNKPPKGKPGEGQFDVSRREAEGSEPALEPAATAATTPAEPIKVSRQDLDMPTVPSSLYDLEALTGAAHELVARYSEHYVTDDGLHPETLIGAAAAVTGEMALRATGMALPEGPGFVVGDAINKMTIEGEAAVWPVVCTALYHAGLKDDELPDPLSAVLRATQAMGSGNYPQLALPDHHLPRDFSPFAAVRFRAKVNEIGARHGLGERQLAGACALATGICITMSSEVLDPRVSGRLALDMMVSCARLAPLSEDHDLYRKHAAA